MMYDWIWGRAIVEKGDEFYFSSADFNGLFRTCKKTGITEYLGRFPEENILEINIHWYAYGTDNEIVFLPRRGHHIHILNTMTGKIEKICVYEAGEEQHIFEEVYVDGDIIYLESKQGKKHIVRCNILEKKVETCQKRDVSGKRMGFEQIDEEFMEKLGDNSNKKIYANIQWTVYDDEWIYALEPFSNNMILYNRKTKEINRKNVIMKDDKFEIDRNELLKEFLKKNIMFENYDFSLNDYLKYI